MAKKKPRGLGRGLEALFGDVEINSNSTFRNPSSSEGAAADNNAVVAELPADGALKNQVLNIDINDIAPNPDQPRMNFSEEKIEELARSIVEHGIIQPIILKKAEQGYTIVAGERRWRAARQAGLKEVPCLIKELDAEQNAILSMIENMQREDLNPMEESKAIIALIEKYGLTQENVAKAIGKSRPYVTNAIRLNKLPEEIQQMVHDELLSGGHARALINIEDHLLQLDIAKKAVANGLSVREVETLADAAKEPSRKKSSDKNEKSQAVLAVEEELKSILGTKVSLKDKNDRGKIEIEYYSREDREQLIEALRCLRRY